MVIIRWKWYFNISAQHEGLSLHSMHIKKDEARTPGISQNGAPHDPHGRWWRGQGPLLGPNLPGLEGARETDFALNLHSSSKKFSNTITPTFWLRDQGCVFFWESMVTFLEFLDIVSFQCSRQTVEQAFQNQMFWVMTHWKHIKHVSIVRLPSLVCCIASLPKQLFNSSSYDQSL